MLPLDLELKLLSGESVVINQIPIYPVSLKQIVEYGYTDFMHALNFFTIPRESLLEMFEKSVSSKFDEINNEIYFYLILILINQNDFFRKLFWDIWSMICKCEFGFKHYGLDLIGQPTIYASGNGTVLSCGCDNILGNVIVIKYEKVFNHKTGKVFDVTVRYNHLASLKVRSGQKVDKDTVLGVMGNTGRYSTGVHLHIEVDTDVGEQYACWTPTLSGNSNILKAGSDSTINPAEVLHVKTSTPDRQTVRRLNDGYSTSADVDMVKIQ